MSSENAPQMDESHAAYLDAAFGAMDLDYPTGFDADDSHWVPREGDATANAVTLLSLAPRSLWVAWRTEDRGGKFTKVPYTPRAGAGRAESDNPASWGTRAEAEARAQAIVQRGAAGGAGLMLAALGDGLRLGGIDLDSCRDPESGTVEEWATDVALAFCSYTEISPSQTGLKIFFTYREADLPRLREVMGSDWGKQFKRAGADHPPAIELYLGNRYFAVTGQQVFERSEIAEIDRSLLIELIRETGPAFKDEGTSTKKAASANDKARKRGRSSTVSTDRSRSAIAFRVGAQARRDGATFEEMCKAIEADPETADWFKEKGKAANGRELRRIWEKAEPDPRPTIKVTAGELHTAATEAEDAILGAGIALYQRGSDLVRPVVQEVPAARGRMTVTAALHMLEPAGLVDVMCGAATWEKFDARSAEWVRTNPPKLCADILLSRVGLWRLPKVVGVVTTPTIRPDGSILSAPGYDAATRLYHAADAAVTLTPEVHNPSREAALRALATLKGLLAEFPFTSEVSRAVALSGLITPVVRGALSVCPLHAFRANTAGSGKSYLVDLASAIASGRPCPVTSAGSDETETEKRLAGMLLAGFPIASIDNVNGELGGDLLCQAIERPFIRLRPLGTSAITEIESRATLFATGNALRVRGDMVRRTLVGDLDAGMERPELRTFKADPVETVMANRGVYISAALVIARAYILAGCPGLLPPIASFADWSGAVRSALVWLGCADPADSMEQAREDDPELAELREVTTLWRETLGMGEALTVKELADRADERAKSQIGEPTDFAHPEWRDCLLRIAGERGSISTKRLGNWLRNRDGRIASGLRLSKGGTAQGGVARWLLKAS